MAEVTARMAAGRCFTSLRISASYRSRGNIGQSSSVLRPKRRDLRPERESAEVPGGRQLKAWLWVVGLIVASSARTVRIVGLTSCRPGMVLLAAAVMATAAAHTTLAALGLETATDFVAIHGAGVDHRKVAMSLALSAERNVVSIDSSGDGRRTTFSVKRAGELGAILLKLQLALTSAVTTLPRHQPLAGDVSRLVALGRILGQQATCQTECQNENQKRVSSHNVPPEGGEFGLSI